MTKKHYDEYAIMIIVGGSHYGMNVFFANQFIPNKEPLFENELGYCIF